MRTRGEVCAAASRNLAADAAEWPSLPRQSARTKTGRTQVRYYAWRARRAGARCDQISSRPVEAAGLRAQDPHQPKNVFLPGLERAGGRQDGRRVE